jgi:limonene-1,2-epoxide hydrolase
MSAVPVQMLSPERVVSEVLRHLNQKEIEGAVACFAANCRYQDHGIGLNFSAKHRVTELFRKTRELYPDYFLQPNQTFVSGEHVITQWTLQVTVTEPFYAGLTRRIPLSIPGVSIARIDNGKVAEWDDYYDGLTSRRTSLAAHFTEWIEY